MVQVINKFFGHEDLSCIGLENDSICNVEGKLNVSFPDMYKNIIKTKNGGAVAYRCFNYFDKYRQEECGGSIDLLPLSNDEDSVVETL